MASDEAGDEQARDAESGRRIDRRKMIAATGLGAAAAWAAPSILSIDAAAAGTKLPTQPLFVGSATGVVTAAGATSVGIGSWTGPNLPLQASDLLVAIISMQNGRVLNPDPPAGWTKRKGPDTNGAIAANQTTYLLTATGLTGTPTVTFNFTATSLTVRAAIVAYRPPTNGTIGVSLPIPNVATNNNFTNVHPFPSATVVEPFSAIVRLGSLGDYLFGTPLQWTTTPAGNTPRLANFNTPGSTNGARAIQITDSYLNTTPAPATSANGSTLNANGYTIVVWAKTP